MESVVHVVSVHRWAKGGEAVQSEAKSERQKIRHVLLGVYVVRLSRCLQSQAVFFERCSLMLVEESCCWRRAVGSSHVFVGPCLVREEISTSAMALSSPKTLASAREHSSCNCNPCVTTENTQGCRQDSAKPARRVDHPCTN